MEIPLFPLPNLVLFPGIVVPLHIFEERYKQMINACIEEQEAFGLLLLREDAQEETDQTIHRVGTTARVVEVERLEGGRMNILCQGETRFRVLHFTRNAPFWKGNIDFLEDDPTDESLLRPLYEEVAAAYRKAFDLGVRLQIVHAAELRLPESAEGLSFMISYVLDIDAERKQTLLELKSTRQRLQELLVDIGEAIRKLEQQLARQEIVRKVRSNGDLGKPRARH